MQYEFYVVRICPETTLQAALEAPAVLPAGGSPTRPLGGETTWALEHAIALLHGQVERVEHADRVEFNFPTEGVHLTLIEYELAVSVDGRVVGPRARQVFTLVFDLLTECSKLGLTVYDTQLKRAVDAGKDFEDVLAAYTRAAQGKRKARPWWKFWAAA